VKHVITKLTLDNTTQLAIDEKRFYLLRKSKSCLVAALTIEENYELLISNYLELEKECLSVTCDNMIRRNQGYSEFFDIRLRFNKRLVNLLTSTKLYIDHVGQHVSSCIPSTCEEKPNISELLSHRYDTHFEYRLMEALRNYVQHRGLAVHSTSMGGTWTSSDRSEGHIEYQTSIYVHKDIGHL
jgi:hypothetical protein